MRKYVMEFVGTFFLFFTVAMAAVAGNAGELAGLAIGAVLMVMIFAGGHISGGHYNPAVTMAVFQRGGLGWREMINYWVSQLAGAGLAALLSRAVFHVTATPLEVDLTQALTAEFLFTFALGFVVVNVATAKGTHGNSFYGLAIGFTVVVGAYAVGKISGGVFNPAVGAGLGAIDKLAWTTIAAFGLAQLVAGAAAGRLFRYLHPGE